MKPSEHIRSIAEEVGAREMPIEGRGSLVLLLALGAIAIIAFRFIFRLQEARTGLSF